MKKYNIGLVIGRFQPFHKGHSYLFSEALKVCEKIIVLVAAQNLHDDNNPYSALTRKRMVKKFLEEEGVSDRVVKIVTQNNYPEDSVWLRNLLKKTGSVDVVVGNNEWVNGIFEGVGIPAVRVGHFKREILEGSKIRKLMKEKKKWQGRVPEYLIALAKQ